MKWISVTTHAKRYENMLKFVKDTSKNCRLLFRTQCIWEFYQSTHDDSVKGCRNMRGVWAEWPVL